MVYLACSFLPVFIWRLLLPFNLFTSNYMPSSPSVSHLSSLGDCSIHLSISALSCLTPASVFPFFLKSCLHPLTYPVFSAAAHLDCFSMLHLPTLLCLALTLHSHHFPLFFSFLPLLLSFPVGFRLHFAVNLPENALAVMKAEGRGNPPGFH